MFLSVDRGQQCDQTATTGCLV